MRWRQALRVFTLLLILGLVAVIVLIHDKDAVILVVITFFLLLLLPSKRAWVGVVGLTLLFADVLFFTGSAALSNIKAHEALTSVAAPAAFAALSVAGVLAGLMALVRYASTAKGARPGVALAVIGLLVFGAAVVTSPVAGTDGGRSRTGDIRLLAKNTKFSPKNLEATASGGKVTVFVTNKDFFWHTFTIDDLHVDLRVPEGGHRRVAFDAKPGTYKFTCTVPGHAQAGMKGTLVVRGPSTSAAPVGDTPSLTTLPSTTTTSAPTTTTTSAPTTTTTPS